MSEALGVILKVAGVTLRSFACAQDDGGGGDEDGGGDDAQDGDEAGGGDEAQDGGADEGGDELVWLRLFEGYRHFDRAKRQEKSRWVTRELIGQFDLKLNF